MSVTNTPNLNLLRIQENWQFGDDAFNRFIDDADDKLVGVSHLESKGHWSTWEKNTEYKKEDIVRISKSKTHQYYQCITGGISDANTEPENDVTGSIVTDGTVKWLVMSLSEPGDNGGDIKIWLSGAYYNRGNCVLYGTSLYRCKTDHTASTWDTDYTYWQEVFASIRVWKPSIYYFVDDSVVQDELIYKCITAHTSGLIFNAAEEANWELIGGVGGAKPWESDKVYIAGQFVINDGILYRAKNKHKSGLTFPDDLTHWEFVNTNIAEWSTDSYYPQGSLVQYENVVYKSLNNHNSGLTNFEDDRLNWVMFHIPTAFIYNWATNTYYYQGQFVRYNDSLYVCNISHISDLTDFSNDGAKWNIVYTSLLQWVSGKYYKVGSVVIYNNDIYKCITANSDSPSFVSSNWEKLTSIFVNNWQPSVKYENGELVINNGLLYRANISHVSGSSFMPEISNWDIVYSSIPSWASGTNYKMGALVIHNNFIYRCTTSNNDVSFDPEKWDKLTAIHIDNWASGTDYRINDVVLYDGVIYRANTNHTSVSEFSTDSSKWDMVYANIRNYTDSTFYKLGSQVIHNGKIYKCIVEHTSISSGFNQVMVYHNPDWFMSITDPASTGTYDLDLGEVKNISSITFYQSSELSYVRSVVYYASTDGINYYRIGNSSNSNPRVDIYVGVNASARYIRMDMDAYVGVSVSMSNLRIIGEGNNWELLSGRESSIFTFELGTKYIKDDVVVYNGKLYRCIIPHISIISFDQNKDKWEPIISDIPDWFTNTKYYAGQYVRYNNKLYKCTTTHTSTTDLLADEDNWESLASNLFDWISGMSYNIGDTVVHNDKIYRCAVATNSATWVNSEWVELSSSDAVSIEEWEPAKYYTIGSYVEVSRQLYKCKVTHTSDSNFLDDIDNWDVLCASIALWEPDITYKEGNIVIYEGRIYRCNSDNEDSAFIGANWDYLDAIDSWDSDKYYPLHVLAVYDNKLYRCIVSHTSTASFDDTKWELFSGGGGSGSGTGYSQIGVNGIVASISNPYVIDIPIVNNPSHILPPIDVLKHMSGYYVIETVMYFNPSDSDKFNYDSNGVKFEDGYMKINQSIPVELEEATPLGDNFTRISKSIDLSIYKSVESVVCV